MYYPTEIPIDRSKPRIYRVFAVTDYLNAPGSPRFVLKTSAPTYCGPHTKIWLTEDGMEDPNCILIQLDIFIPTTDNLPLRVTFFYDGGRYIGEFSSLEGISIGPSRMHWANNIESVGFIQDISSL